MMSPPFLGSQSLFWYNPSMPRFDACLFDYGNTIIEFDTTQADSILRRLADALSERIAPLDLNALRKAVTHAHLLPHLGDPPSFLEMSPEDQMAWVLERAYGETLRPERGQIEYANGLLQNFFVESVSIEPDVVRFLTWLGQRCRVGLVSNYPCGQAIRRSLEKEGIKHLLDPIVVSGDVGFVKPHPEPFEVALAALGLEPQRVLFVGDRWDMDMVGAEKMGMATCHITGWTSDGDWGERYEAYRPDYVVERLSELEGIFVSE